MSVTYNITTNFGAKDTLPALDPDKTLLGAEYTVEFNAIKASFNLCAPAANPTFTGTLTTPTLIVNGVATVATLNATGTVSAPAIVGTSTVTGEDVIGDTSVTSPTVNATTSVVTPLVTTTDVNAVGIITGLTVTATGTVSGAVVSGPIGNLTTVNATTVNSTTVTATGVVTGDTGAFPTELSTDDLQATAATVGILNANGYVNTSTVSTAADTLVLSNSSTSVEFDALGLFGVFNNNGTHNSDSLIETLTQAQYDALTPDANTLYFIT